MISKWWLIYLIAILILIQAVNHLLDEAYEDGRVDQRKLELRLNDKHVYSEPTKTES